MRSIVQSFSSSFLRVFAAAAFSVLVPGVGGCASAADDAQPADEANAGTTAEELSSRAPLPYVLQFAGTYENAAAPAGHVNKLVLSRTGRYTARITGQTKTETGASASLVPSRRALSSRPMSCAMTSVSVSLTNSTPSAFNCFRASCTADRDCA